MGRLHTQIVPSAYFQLWFHYSRCQSKNLLFKREFRKNKTSWIYFKQKPDCPKISKVSISFGSCWLSARPDDWYWEKSNRWTFFDACIKNFIIIYFRKQNDKNTASPQFQKKFCNFRLDFVHQFLSEVLKTRKEYLFEKTFLKIFASNLRYFDHYWTSFQF